jgi:hypothetical protein
MLETVRVPEPGLERFTVCVGLEVPAVMLEKVREEALRLAMGADPTTLTWAQVALANGVPVEVVPLSEM